MFWLRRFVGLYAIAFVVLLLVGPLRRRTWPESARHAAVWGLVFSTVWVATAWFRARRGQGCALCRVPADPSKQPPG
jgi:hypothetical protein